ncbi:GNAT family N-acetyltransferase [Calothrix sp. PCC 6303]|uniref:GNAT family N-acetyltransferase n=1 Tax=Calothrix sp. PCC 6303 TaxID=1170562 RepID=UPI0002A0370B|nr:GNAT family N-acetyltransferase [Calothrix sp. PCC 6303]AFZ04417.1 GCN5-related N-acetyltransferase [Calothrix sp. PCC 6303]
MSTSLPSIYKTRCGSTKDKALLVKFMQQTYQEISPQQDFSHLTRTVEQYLSTETPIWWVDIPVVNNEIAQKQNVPKSSPIGCLWMGNAIDQITNLRYAHIFLLYVIPEYRQQGIGKQLMQEAEIWAEKRGDGQIGLQVFQTNIPALSLYEQLGYQTQSLTMVKYLNHKN